MLMHPYKLTVINNSIYFQLPCILMHPYQLFVCQVYLCWSVLTVLMHTGCSIHSQLRCISALICTFTALMHPYHWWLGIMVPCIPLLISTYCTHAPVPTESQWLRRTLPAIPSTPVHLYLLYSYKLTVRDYGVHFHLPCTLLFFCT